MAETMVRQYRQKGDPNYCYTYFYNSIAEMYHVARSCSSVQDNNFFPKTFYKEPKELAEEDQKPYFTEGTPQFRWRVLYNQFCEKLTNSGLVLDDQRFASWSVPDLKMRKKKLPLP